MRHRTATILTIGTFAVAGTFVILLMVSSGESVAGHPDGHREPTGGSPDHVSLVTPVVRQDGALSEVSSGETDEEVVVGASTAHDDIGQLPVVRADDNPQVAIAARAGLSGNHPERVSSAYPPAAFDEAAYRRDPEAYLSVPEPGRVFHPAPPGPTVPRLGLCGPGSIDLAQGDACELAVEAVPGAPVTFTSFAAGHFANKLTTITVAAGDDGVARATFSATRGVFAECPIMAASPLCAGQVTITITVIPPNSLETQP